MFRVTGRGRIGADGLVTLSIIVTFTFFSNIKVVFFSTSLIIHCNVQLNVLFCRHYGILKAKVLKVLCLVPMINGMVLVYFLIHLIMTTNTTIPSSWQ